MWSCSDLFLTSCTSPSQVCIWIGTTGHPRLSWVYHPGEDLHQVLCTLCICSTFHGYGLRVSGGKADIFKQELKTHSPGKWTDNVNCNIVERNIMNEHLSHSYLPCTTFPHSLILQATLHISLNSSTHPWQSTLSLQSPQHVPCPNMPQLIMH